MWITLLEIVLLIQLIVLSLIYQKRKDMITTQILHETIKSKLATRTNEELISDAKVARQNKADETQRMIFALAMDVLATRISETEFDTLYEEIAG